VSGHETDSRSAVSGVRGEGLWRVPMNFWRKLYRVARVLLLAVVVLAVL